MRVVRRPQQQRRRVDRAARHDDERRRDAHASRRRARPRPPRPVVPAASVISRRAQRVGPQRRRSAARSPAGRSRPRRRSSRGCWHGNELQVLQSMQPPGSPGSQQPERQRRRMQALRAQLLDDAPPCRRVRDRRIRKRPARRLGRIDAGLAVHVVQALGAVVVRRERVVVDRPRRRHAVDVLDRLEILAPQPVQHAAPELRVAADAVVRVRPELAAALVEPALGRPVAQVLPDRRPGSSSRSSCGTKSPRSRIRMRAPRRRPARAPSCRRRRRCR